MNSQEVLERVMNDKSLIEIAEKLSLVSDKSVNLVGGAIIDILDGRVPKDYDFLFSGISIENVYKGLMDVEEFEFISDSNTALTYLFRGKTVQILKKTTTSDFDFTISKAEINVVNPTVVFFDFTSYKSRKLIPTQSSRDNPILPLRRIPHWSKKGFECPEITYQGLLTKLVKDLNEQQNLNS